MKSDNLSTPDVRISRSSGGSDAVKRWDVTVEEVMSSGFLYWCWGASDFEVLGEDNGFDVGEPV